MNLFEDLIEELKEDNLLEVAIVDSAQENEADQFLHSDLPAEKISILNTDEASDVTIDNEEVKHSQVDTNASENLINIHPSDVGTITEDKTTDFEEINNEVVETAEVTKDYSKLESSPTLNDSINVSAIKTDPTFDEPVIDTIQVQSSEIIEASEVKDNQEVVNTEADSDLNEENIGEQVIPEVPEELVNSTPAEEPFVKEEFYRRRALDQVNGLEMVEHVISGVEREQMKLVPTPYDEVIVKKALHEFLMLADDLKSPEHSKLEFNLLQECEKWTVAMAKRDCNIPVGHLRRYSETTKPSLSSQALISLARFYRNAPFTEDVRGKFDLVVTKLFTEDLKDEKRNLAFEPKELSEHIQELYADWSSTPLYLTEEEDSQLLLSALKFQDFTQEAENAKSFDELIKKDFFRRLKAFKEKTSENFFAPILVAAAIDCNVVVGNRYVELLEQDKKEGKNLGDKYGEIHDRSISDATSKTVHLLDTLREKGALKVSKNKNKKSLKKGAGKDILSSAKNNGFFKASKWLIIATLVTIILACVYLFFSNTTSKANSKPEVPKNVKVVNLENSSLKEYVNSARISEGTLIAVSSDGWSQLEFKKKQDVVEKFVRTGADKDYSKVHIVNSEGGSVAFGSKDGVNIVE